MKYIAILTEHVEKKISSVLTSNSAIAFDGWTTGSDHYVCVSATHPPESEIRYNTRLLAFSTFEDSTSQSTKSHVEFLQFVLGVYGKSLDNVIALIADNCSTKRSISECCSKPIWGCSSHRYNLAGMDFIDTHKVVIEKVSVLMSRLCYSMAAAKLREHTHLKAIGFNRTRWSSTYNMLKRY